MSRPLLNPHDLLEWASKQSFAQTLSPDDFHVTIAYSTKPVHWRHFQPHTNELHVVGDQRDIIPLGDKGATVLRFFHPHLHQRWKHFVTHGASWDHEHYHPHVTISYEPHAGDLKSIHPYSGPLIFGPEKFAPIVLDWDKQIEEIPLVVENNRVLPVKFKRGVKYGASIMENKRMTETLASLLMNNIDLIMEAHNLDNKGNLVEVNKKKAAECDRVFHEYFVKSMNGMFRQINEADPIMHEPNNMMSPMGDMNGMHGMDGGLGEFGGAGEDPMADEHMGHAMMGDMDMDPNAGMYGDPAAQHMGHGHQGHHGHPGHMNPAMGGMGGMGGMGESAEGGEYDWVFSEDAGLDVDALFNLTEEDDEEDAVNEEDEEPLNEFMDSGHDEMMGGSMDMGGGANDFGGDMGGADMMGGDDQGMGGDDMMGGDDDMMTIHGTTDNGGEFEFSFDKDALGFDGGDAGDMDDMDMGGGGDEHHMDASGMGSHEHGHGEEEENPIGEAAMVKKGKPGKGQRGPKTARMAVVPANPATNHAAPFPTPQGSRQKH